MRLVGRVGRQVLRRPRTGSGPYHAGRAREATLLQARLLRLPYRRQDWHTDRADSVLVQMIAEGIDRRTGVMPPFGHLLRPDEVRTLIAFIKTFWTPAQQQF